MPRSNQKAVIMSNFASEGKLMIIILSSFFLMGTFCILNFFMIQLSFRKTMLMEKISKISWTLREFTFSGKGNIPFPTEGE
jgi:hypothetical protein